MSGGLMVGARKARGVGGRKGGHTVPRWCHTRAICMVANQPQVRKCAARCPHAHLGVVKLLFAAVCRLGKIGARYSRTCILPSHPRRTSYRLRDLIRRDKRHQGKKVAIICSSSKFLLSISFSDARAVSQFKRAVGETLIQTARARLSSAELKSMGEPKWGLHHQVCRMH